MHIVEAEIGRIAGAQDTAISRKQLLAAGLTRAKIATRARTGALQRRHYGVYLVGPAAPTFRRRAWAALLIVDNEGTIGLHGAGHALGLLDGPPGLIHVIAERRASPRRDEGVVFHRWPLDPSDRITVNGLWVTSPARTICDLAARGYHMDADDALTEARVKGIVTDQQLLMVLDRMPNGQGCQWMRELIVEDEELGYTRSRAERRLRRLLGDAELPAAIHNRHVRGLRVDAVWPEHRLVIEVDGHRGHGHRAAFEEDRRRDQILVAAGFRVIRITWRQLLQQPIAVAVRIAQALAHCETV